MKKVLLLLLFPLVAAAGFAQIPFVSKLKAAADESRIHITWRNPKNLQGNLLLYRHSAEIDEDNLNDAVLVTRLAADQESFEDSPADDRLYYYAVLIEDSSGTAPRLLVPFRNKSSQGARISVLPTVESLTARITDIRAAVSDDSVEVSFRVSNPSRDLLLFRSHSPMGSSEDLLDAFTPLQLERGTTRFIDFPIPGVEVYYAVIDSESFKLGKQMLVAGENTTAEAAVVPLEVQRVGLPPVSSQGTEVDAVTEQPSRQEPVARIQTAPGAPTSATAPTPPAEQALTGTPLPYLQLSQGSTGSFSQPAGRLDPRTQAAISRILSSAPPVQVIQKTVLILPEDKNAPAAGESASLQNILQEYLLAGDYTETESKLQGFLNLRRTPFVEARVRFYLGQAYYFQGLYEEALLEFVLSQDQLYAPVQPWLESCFRHIWKEP